MRVWKSQAHSSARTVATGRRRARSFYNRSEVEKREWQVGADARAPTRGSDEEGRLVCSIVNGGSDKQSGGHRLGHSWAKRDQQTILLKGIQ
jgi:hypothetical protein